MPLLPDTQKEHIGYEAELYKIVTVKGKEKERIRINRSNSFVIARIVTGFSRLFTNFKSLSSPAIAASLDNST